MANDHLASVSYDEDGEKVASPIGGGDGGTIAEKDSKGNELKSGDDSKLDNSEKNREMPTLSFVPEGEGLSKEIYNCASELIELTNQYS